MALCAMVHCEGGGPRASMLLKERKAAQGRAGLEAGERCESLELLRCESLELLRARKRLQPAGHSAVGTG